ncbi:MAG TPA: LysE family translocator [Aurantimonas coralicida]|uniref:LysE family translocator n=2 Tax=root TaxID=1 RepID=A0A9C9TIX4_9HYPH|nr:LysE family translocator [Aurantimonas coralicida]HEU02779.1 LysE family translocator [Aurantimonas coralicida]
MDITSLIIFAGALFVAAGSPGPSIAALVARVLVKGWRDVLPFLLAMWIGEAIWLTAAILGLSALATSFHLVFVAVKYAGVGYLLYLAWKMWMASAKTRESSEIPHTDAPRRLFFAGLAVTLGNPKIMLFYLALLPTIVDLTAVTLLGWAELAATMLLVLIVIDFAWTALAEKARGLFSSPRAMRFANRGSATLMAGAAGVIATR